MIISRTPFRVSFVGGGTDLKSYWERGEAGQVISTSIDKYIYVSVKRLADIYPFKYRIVWSVLECVNEVDDIQHPIVREAIKLLRIDDPLEVVTYADLPSHTGLGSSSSFAVGLLNALHAFKGEKVSSEDLAREAAHIEIDILKRPIGKQDHYAAAFGNLNVIRFNLDGTTKVIPVPYKEDVKKAIAGNLLMFYTAKTRDAGSILKTQSQNIRQDDAKYHAMTAMKNLVPEMETIFNGGTDLHKFGELLHQNWILKKQLTSYISDTDIDGYYAKTMQAGAVGGKLLGAGGGGFMLFYVEKENHQRVREALRGLYELQFNFEELGSHVIYYRPDL